MIERFRPGLILLITAIYLLGSLGPVRAAGWGDGSGGDAALFLLSASNDIKERSRRKRKSKKKRRKSLKKPKKEIDEEDELLMDDDDDEELLKDFDQPPPMLDKVRTVLLDIRPVDASEAMTEGIYGHVKATLKGAEDLGEILDRSDLGRGKLYRHVVQTCQGIDNSLCLRGFARGVNARYAIYGELRDLDDMYLLLLEMMDVRTGRILETTRAKISKPARDINKRACEAACRLVRLYGCAPEKPPAPGAFTAFPEQTESEPVSEAPDLEDDYFTTEERKPTAPDDASDVTKSDEGGLSGMAIGGCVMAGFGGAALVGGATTTALWIKAMNEYNSAKEGEGEKARDAKDRAIKMQWTSLGLYATAAALTAGGVTMIVLVSRQEDNSGSGGGDEWVAPMVGPKTYGLMIGGSF